MSYYVYLFFGLIIVVVTIGQDINIDITNEKPASNLNCIYEPNSLACSLKRIAKEINSHKLQMSDEKIKTQVSQLFKKGGSLLEKSIQAFFGFEDNKENTNISKNKGYFRKGKLSVSIFQTR